MKKTPIILLLLIIYAPTFGKEIRTQILIKSSPDKVWAILTDFEKYPNWNPFIVYVAGELREGRKLKIRIHPPDLKPSAFSPKVLIVDRVKRIVWQGRLLLPRVFDGKHMFELIDNGNGTTTFVQREIFRGILVGLFKKKLNTNTKKGFEEMNKKLKELAEM